MPTFVHGRNSKVLVDKYDLSRYFREGSVSAGVDLTDTTTFGSPDREYILGWVESMISLGGIFEATTDLDPNVALTQAADEFLKSILGDDIVHLVTYAPHGTVIGRRVTQGQGRESNLEFGASISDVIAVSVEFMGEGVVRTGVSLFDMTAQGASVDGASVDNAAASTTGGIAQLHVTANSRSTNSTIEVQHSVDNSVWATIATFAVVPTNTQTSERIVIPGTINRYLRAKLTLTAGTGNITFHVSFVRTA